MKKLTIALTAVANTRAVYYNSALVDIIMGDKYPVLLYDSTGEQVPFGLNKWSVDSSNGYLSFLDGEPSGFTAPYTVTFYKYIGRTITTGMVLRLVERRGGAVDRAYNGQVVLVYQLDEAVQAAQELPGRQRG